MWPYERIEILKKLGKPTDEYEWDSVASTELRQLVIKEMV